MEPTGITLRKERSMIEDYCGMTKEEWLAHSQDWMSGFRTAKENHPIKESYYNKQTEEWKQGYHDGRGQVELKVLIFA